LNWYRKASIIFRKKKVRREGRREAAKEERKASLSHFSSNLN